MSDSSYFIRQNKYCFRCHIKHFISFFIFFFHWIYNCPCQLDIFIDTGGLKSWETITFVILMFFLFKIRYGTVKNCICLNTFLHIQQTSTRHIEDGISKLYEKAYVWKRLKTSKWNLTLLPSVCVLPRKVFPFQQNFFGG